MNTAIAIHIASNALISLGHNPISDFNEDGVGARVAKNFYETSVRALLQAYPWTFAKKKVSLNRMVETPLNDYQYMFQIPTDSLKVLTVNGGVDYEIFEDKIYCDQDKIDLDYCYRVDESFWTPLFREYVENYLAAKWAVPVTENAATMEGFLNIAELMRRKAQYDDAQARPTRSPQHVAANPLRIRHRPRWSR